MFLSCTPSVFLLITCFGPDQDGTLNIILGSSDGRCLCKVRVEYTTFSSIHPRFLDSTDSLSPSGIHPPIHHVTADSFVPPGLSHRK